MFKRYRTYQEKVSQMISWGHWFTLFNILLILPLASRYLFVSDWPRTLGGRLYALFSWLGHFSFLTFAVYLLLLFPLTFVVVSQRLLRIISSIVATAGITLIVIDAEIFDRFRLHLNSTVWNLVVNPEQADLAKEWQVLFIAIPAIFLIQMLFSTWSWEKLRSLDKRANKVKPLILLFVAAFVGSHLTHIWADANFYRPITMQKANYPLSYPLTARRFLEKHGLLDRDAYKEKVQEQGSPAAVAIEYPLNKIHFSADKPTGFNLLMVVVDGIRNRSFYEDMPFTYSFAQNNLQFTQHYSAGVSKDPSLVGLLYGISPSYTDSILSWHKPSALIDTLNQRGYKFQLLAADGFNTPLYRQTLFADYQLPARTPVSNEQITKKWQQWLPTQGAKEQPWFSYIDFSNTALTQKPSSNEQFTADYHKQANAIDEQIQQLIQSLETTGQLDKTVVVITASMGVEFNDSKQNVWGINDNYTRAQLQVPLTIHWPGRAPETITKMTGHEDIMTTLMQSLLLVSNNPSDYSHGENLFLPERHFNWVIAGDKENLVITTPEQTIILNDNGHYQLLDKDYKEEKENEPSLALLLQILTETKRFIAG